MSKSKISGLFLLVLLATTTAHSHGEERPLSRLRWLVGRWENVRPRLVMDEAWLPAVGNTMMGVGRVVKSDSLVTYEIVIIREVGSRFAYEAHPAGQETTTFMSTVVNDSTIIFENPAHDFPQRIGYQLVGPDSLYAWIEGTVRGKVKRNEFPYQRAIHSK
ncbi:MAG TPA: DUF6265 family protein [Candidatus Krumholzibacteria bacterium]